MAYESLGTEDKGLLKALLLDEAKFTGTQIAEAINLTTTTPFNIEGQQVGHFRRKMRMGKVTLE